MRDKPYLLKMKKDMEEAEFQWKNQ